MHSRAMRVCDIQLEGEERAVSTILHHRHPRTHQTQYTNKTTPALTGFVPLVYSYGTLIKQHPLQGYLLNPSSSQLF